MTHQSTERGRPARRTTRPGRRRTKQGTAAHSDQNLNPEARRALAETVKTAYLQLRGPGPPREALRRAPERP